jgi:hypothetical protein
MAKLKSEIEAENLALAKKNKELEKQKNSLENKMDELEAMMKKLMEQPKVEPREIASEVQSNTIMPIASNEYVRVTSLTNGKLNLSTKGSGRGTVFTFMGFGQTKNITYENLENIVNNNRKMAENGLFYIQNEKAVRDLMLDEFYKNILDEDAINAIVKGDGVNISEVFSLASKKQQDQIVNLIIKGAVAGGNIDYNEINKISELYGKDLMNMISEAKSFK